MATSKAKKAAPTTDGAVAISRPDFRTIQVKIIGTAPLVINRFSARSADKMRMAQEAGGASKSKKTRDPKDFDQVTEDAKHISSEGWEGFHAAAIRNACISACRAAGFKMTLAKLAVFVDPDGLDKVDATPLVRLTGKAEQWVTTVRNSSGVVDLRPRPLYRDWSATLRISYDAGLLQQADIINLLHRAGRQVGIGEGRPDSRMSAGLGFGTFRLESIAD